MFLGASTIFVWYLDHHYDSTDLLLEFLAIGSTLSKRAYPSRTLRTRPHVQYRRARATVVVVVFAGYIAFSNVDQERQQK